MASLALSAYLLTLLESEAAGRAYAAYGGNYVAAAILWLWGLEGHRPDRWDVIGGLVMPARRRPDHIRAVGRLNPETGGNGFLMER